MRPVLLILCAVLIQCSLFTPRYERGDLTEIDGYWQACKERCYQEYPLTIGIKATQITLDVIKCVCLRSRGDKLIYLNVEQYEKEEDTRVDRIY